MSIEGTEIKAIEVAIERLHNCKASFRSIELVRETFMGKVVWEGEVSTFSLEGHPKAKICYAWSSPIEGSDKRKFYAVLKLPPIETPEDAVRAAIVSDYKKG